LYRQGRPLAYRVEDFRRQTITIRNAYAKNKQERTNKACTKAGLARITPHDLRHTWCSRLGEKGVDDRTLQELGGWKTLKMVQRYSHTNDRRKAEAVKLLESFHNATHNTELAPLAAVR